MTSFGAEKDLTNRGFFTTYKVQGQVYHLLGSLLPLPEETPKFLQVYFINTSDDEAKHRCSLNSGVRMNIIQQLQDMLHQSHPYVASFKYALEQMQTPNHKVVINADKRPAGEHIRRFNAPSASEVAIVMVGQQHGKRDIILKHRDNHLTRIMETHRAYDSLQYPLLLPRGEDGYNFDLRQSDQKTGQKTDKSVFELLRFSSHGKRWQLQPDSSFQRSYKSILRWHVCEDGGRASTLPSIKPKTTKSRAVQWSAGCHQYWRKCQQCGPESNSTIILHWLSTLHERTGPGCHVVRAQTWAPWFVYNIYMQSEVGRHRWWAVSWPDSIWPTWPHGPSLPWEAEEATVASERWQDLWQDLWQDGKTIHLTGTQLVITIFFSLVFVPFPVCTTQCSLFIYLFSFSLFVSLSTVLNVLLYTVCPDYEYKISINQYNATDRNTEPLTILMSN